MQQQCVCPSSCPVLQRELDAGRSVVGFLGGFSVLQGWFGFLSGVQPCRWGFSAVKGCGIVRSCEGDLAEACKGGECLEGKRG